MMGLGIAQCVSNVHAFIILHDLETDKDYGMHVEVANTSFSHSGIGGEFELEGTLVAKEVFDLDAYERFKERALHGSLG